MLAGMVLTTGWFLMGLQFYCRAHGASAEMGWGAPDCCGAGRSRKESLDSWALLTFGPLALASGE